MSEIVYSEIEKLRVENFRLRARIVQLNQIIAQQSNRLENIDLFNEQEQLVKEFNLSSAQELDKVR